MFKEDALVINDQNDQILKPEMTLHVRMAFSNVHKDVGRSVVAIGDTIVVQRQGAPLVITKEIRKRFADISYQLEESDAEPAKADPKAKKAEKPLKKQESEEDEESTQDSFVIKTKGGCTPSKTYSELDDTSGCDTWDWVTKYGSNGKTDNANWVAQSPDGSFLIVAGIKEASNGLSQMNVVKL